MSKMETPDRLANCPNCGAPLIEDRCEYCGSDLFFYFNGKTRRHAMDELIKETNRIQMEIENCRMTDYILSTLSSYTLYADNEPIYSTNEATRLFDGGAISARTWRRLMENGGN